MYKEYKVQHKKFCKDLKFISSHSSCILFDIDGVLIDIRRSYNLTIKRTVDLILKYAMGDSAPKGLVTDKIILRMRQTGGFNNDTDTSYIISLAALANPKKNTQELRNVLIDLSGSIDEGGINSAEKFLSSRYNINKPKEFLCYPAPVGKSVVATVFDELFYGPKLFKKRHGFKPQYYLGRPLIENDNLVVTVKTIYELSRRFEGNLAVVSGRSKLAAKHSLRPIFDVFNLSGCAFLEDESRQYAKPNPYAIMRSMLTLRARTAIYVGDSVEDLLMVRMAEKKTGFRIVFFGIYGYSTSPFYLSQQLMKNGADIVIKNVNYIPDILNKSQ
jgi:phosphoglycolate phosphatase-like HAD superfamily hydrolase